MKSKLAFLALSLVVSASAHAAASYHYTCAAAPYNDGSFGETLKVTVTASTLEVNDVDNNAVGSGTLNPAYRPQRANAGKVQYQGFDDMTSESYFIRFLVDKTMQTGAATGEVKAQASGEGYLSGTWTCTRE